MMTFLKMWGHYQKNMDFRLYLENAGFVDAIVKALIQLYDEQQKPEDVNQYIAKSICNDISSLKDRIAILEKTLKDNNLEVPIK